MSAHRTPVQARHIVQVLRNGAIARTGSLRIEEVEVLEGVLRANAALVAAARQALDVIGVCIGAVCTAKCVSCSLQRAITKGEYP